MDAGDDLSDPITLITDPAKSANNPDNPAMTAGFTFLGQFVDHDMTFDPTSSLARRQDPEAIRNFRIPALDLDNVYGGGPGASPHLYDATVDGGRTTLLVEEIPGSAAVSVDGSTRFDLPRNSQLTALLGDPRNDENLIVSQFHLALLRFHNRVVDDVKAELGAGYTAGEIFAEAQRVVRWHYQWLVLHEFLRRRRSAARWPRRCAARDRSTSSGATTRTSRSSSPSPRTASGTRRCGRATAGTSARAPPTRRSSSSPCSSTRRPPTRTTRPTCAAAGARRAASSTGRRSSTSATTAGAATSASTPRCRASCSS